MYRRALEVILTIQKKMLEGNSGIGLQERPLEVKSVKKNWLLS